MRFRIQPPERRLDLKKRFSKGQIIGLSEGSRRRMKLTNSALPEPAAALFDNLE